MGNVHMTDITKDSRRTVQAEDLTASMPAALLASEEPGVLIQILAEKMVQLDGRIRNLLIWPQIDVLPETLLDIIAGDMHIDWYDYDADIDIKRTIIKAGVAVHKRLGTLWAVQKVITDYFGAGEVREWDTYGGEPHHFKVVSGNAQMVGENLDRFTRMLEHVKRKSSWLDSVEIGMTAENMTYAGIAYAEHDVERVEIEDHTSGTGETNFGPKPSETDKNIAELEEEILNRAETAEGEE